jgi:hypothetical protein
MKAAKPLKGSTLRLYRRNLETGVLVHTLEVRDYADLTRTSGDESLDRWFGGRYRDRMEFVLRVVETGPLVVMVAIYENGLVRGCAAKSSRSSKARRRSESTALPQNIRSPGIEEGGCETRCCPLGQHLKHYAH